MRESKRPKTADFVLADFAFFVDFVRLFCALGGGLGGWLRLSLDLKFV